VGLKNIFDAGNFAFYRDPELTMELSSANLFDQISPDGWVDIYLGGRDIFIPEVGNFKAHLITDQTFFWDILDENGNRTKEGFESLWISKNPNMIPYYGDLVPKDPYSVFPFPDKYTFARTETKLIVSNIWFYNNLFLDNYFRYYLVLLPRGIDYPNESKTLLMPMNDKMTIPANYWIAAYRPKPEYRYQLAVMPIIKSGKENAIHFRFKVNLDYLFANPTAKRVLRVFSSSRNDLRYLLFPEDPKDIIWDMYQKPFIPEYKRYLLTYSVQQRLPTQKEIDRFMNIRKELLYYSNILAKLDGFNIAQVGLEIKKKLKDPDYELHGIAAYVWKAYKTWLDNRFSNSRPTTVSGILTYILFKKWPWTGFERLYRYSTDIVEVKSPVALWDGMLQKIDGNIVYVDGGDYTPAYPNPVKIVEIDGIKQFSDGYVPKRAVEYLSPTRPGYYYAGATGDGMYLLNVNGKNIPVYCDMKNGGWMLIMDGMLVDKDYVASMVRELPDGLIIEEDKGVTFGKINAPEVLEYPDVEFQEIKFTLWDIANNCGWFKVEIYNQNNLFAVCEQLKDNSGCYSQLIVDNNVIYTNNKLEKADFYQTKKYDNIQKSLSIKMVGDIDMDKVRKYIKFVWIR